MGAMSPTDSAKMNFQLAQRKAQMGGTHGSTEQIDDTVVTLGYLSAGLIDLATGLRAVYVKLEQIESALAQNGILVKPGAPPKARKPNI